MTMMENLSREGFSSTRAHTPLGFKWLGVLHSRLQAR